jgi:hypothetical protein
VADRIFLTSGAAVAVQANCIYHQERLRQVVIPFKSACRLVALMTVTHYHIQFSTGSQHYQAAQAAWGLNKISSWHVDRLVVLAAVLVVRPGVNRQSLAVVSHPTIQLWGRAM